MGRPAQMTPAANYKYGSAPVPFRDFSFATTWRLGRGGTSSNRKDRQASIQIFSEAGCYNADCTPRPSPKLIYKRVRDTDEEEIQGMPQGDLPWEAPRKNPNAYDPGPSAAFATLLMGLDKRAPYPDFWAMGARTHRSFGFHGPYRGRLNEAAVLILADQESNDDLFTGRAWTGLGGQRLQAYLEALGIQRKYAILKTLPIDTFDLPSAKRREMVMAPKMLIHREAMVRGILSESKKNKVSTVVVLAIGPFAAEAADALIQAKVISSQQLLKLPFPQNERGIGVWTGQFPALAKMLKGVERAKQARTYEGEHIPIARIDLPIQTKWWVGANGSRGYRAVNTNLGKRDTPIGQLDHLDPNYYKIYMPKWVFEKRPTALSPQEVREIGALEKEMNAADGARR